jgi:hypothetical protein
MSPRRLWFGAAALALIAALCLLLPRLEKGPGQPANPAPQQRIPSPVAAPQAVAVTVQLPSEGPEQPSQLAVGLNSPTGDARTDLRIINQVFDAFRAALHNGNPVGENSEITAALTGRNKLGFAFIPKDCPAIDSKGELCDRWGRPYFFHQISGEKMEIRSAGPDGKLWTDDDEVLTP